MDLTNLNKEKKSRRKTAPDMAAMIYGKVPPQAKELEAAILGAIIIEGDYNTPDADSFETACLYLKAESFYVDAHQRIFRAMRSMTDNSRKISSLSLIEELRRREELDLVGGPYAITKLTEKVVSSAYVEEHSKIVAERFTKRELIRISGETITDAYEDSTDAFDVMDAHEKKLTELSVSRNTAGVTHISTGLVSASQRIEKRRQSTDHITGVPSGFNSLDHVTHGFQDTDLIILAARPSVGKTAFALNLARNAVSHPTKPTPVAFFSLEMSTDQLIERIISAESETWLEKIATGNLEEHEMKKLYEKGIQKLFDTQFFIDDTPGLNVFELRAKARRLRRKHNIGMIIIDYLQLMSGTNDGGRVGNREQDISNISRSLKGLAKELRIPIIALSQLSREVEKRKEGNKMPVLSDLRESGAIEQDADMVMFLYRPEYYDQAADEMGESTKGETHIKIAKHRNGKLDLIKLRALLHIQKFVEMDASAAVSQPPSNSNDFPPGFRFMGQRNSSDDEFSF